MSQKPGENDAGSGGSEFGDSRDPPPPTLDPRLEIPEVLRKPVRQPVPAPEPPRSWGQAAAAWGVALDFVFTIIAGAVLGWLIDKWLKSSPWGVLGGLALGFGVAFVRIVKRTQASTRPGGESGRKPGS